MSVATRCGVGVRSHLTETARGLVEWSGNEDAS